MQSRVLPYNATEIAAKYGRIEILETLVGSGFPWLPSAVEVALDNGHKEVYYWAEEKGLDIAWFSKLRVELQEEVSLRQRE